MPIPRRISPMAAILLLTTSASAFAQGLFRITVVDAATGRGVPLVELTTTSHVTYVTDSAGVVAFNEPGLFGQKVHFSIKSHGYAYPKDGFGYAGVVLDVERGGSATIKLPRVNIAQRLYRITGQGIYRDSVLLGDQPPIEHPLLNGLVMGQDTVEVIPYRDELYWFWGDTGWPRYPLGNFAVSGAWSRMPAQGGLDPDVGVNLHYFVDERGFSKKMCPIEGPGPVWIDGLMTLADESGRARLLAKYARMKSLGETYERGLAMFNDDEEVFEPIQQFDLDAPLCARSHSVRVAEDDGEYYYFPAPIPSVRVRANIDAAKNTAAYESFTCLRAGSRYDADAPNLDRDEAGRLHWAWKADTAPVEYSQQQELIKRGLMRPEEAWIHLRDVDTGAAVLTSSGSVYYNAYRRRWVMIAQQQWGAPSILGEVWFAEADTLLGPWVYAKKIVTHDDYTFYNVTHHPFFDTDGGRRIYFEGTYTASFSGSDVKTPRYDYNQIMYALDLDDPRLTLPVPVYETKSPGGATHYLTGDRVTAHGGWSAVQRVAFFAIPADRRRAGLVAVVPASADATDDMSSLRVVPLSQAPPADKIAFLALPPEPTPDAEPVVPLFEYRPSARGSRVYATDADGATGTMRRGEKPLCHVWRSPVQPLYFDPTTKPFAREGAEQ